jgi:hypothetical protein
VNCGEFALFLERERTDEMKHTKALGVGLLVAALVVAGCGKQNDTKTEAGTGTGTKKTGKTGGGHKHGKGPNGGVVIDLGAYHAEFTIDHKKKECTVLFIDGDNEDAKPLPVAAKDLTVTTKQTKTKDGKKVVEPMTIKLTPKDEKDGKATTFVGTDPGLEHVADHEGTVFGTIDGKPARNTFKEE